MKKLLTVLFICVITICCAFAFTACGENDPSDNPNNDSTENNQTEKDKFAVTADEWSAATAILCNRTESMTVTFCDDKSKDEFMIEYDKQNTAVHIKHNLVGRGLDCYMWKNGEKYYKGEKDVKRVEEISQKDFWNELKVGIYDYGYCEVLELSDYNDYTYSETTHEYTSDKIYNVYDTVCKTTIKFENAKIVKQEIYFIKDEITVTNTYNYGTTVTVPDEIKNLPFIPDGERFMFDLVMESSLDELVNEVRESFLKQEVKDAVIVMLQKMCASLKGVSLKSEAESIIRATVSGIDLLITDANSFRKISGEFASFDANLSTAIVKGFVTYKGRLTSSLNINYVNSLKTDLGEYIERAMEEWVKESSSALKVKRLVYNEGEKNLSSVLEEYYLNMDGALAACGIDENDELYQSLLTLSNGLKSLKASVDRGGAPNSQYWGIIDQHYENMTTAAISALEQQGYNCIMENYIRQQLAKTLGISFNGLTPLYADLIYEGDDGTGGDGAGSGDIIYGSDDLIYYPVGIEDSETGEIKYYVPFGQVLAEYETAINNGALAEDFPEYLKDFLEQYMIFPQE